MTAEINGSDDKWNDWNATYMTFTHHSITLSLPLVLLISKISFSFLITFIWSLSVNFSSLVFHFTGIMLWEHEGIKTLTWCNTSDSGVTCSDSEQSKIFCFLSKRKMKKCDKHGNFRDVLGLRATVFVTTCAHSRDLQNQTKMPKKFQKILCIHRKNGKKKKKKKTSLRKWNHPVFQEKRPPGKVDYYKKKCIMCNISQVYFQCSMEITFICKRGNSINLYACISIHSRKRNEVIEAVDWEVSCLGVDPRSFSSQHKEIMHGKYVYKMREK